MATDSRTLGLFCIALAVAVLLVAVVGWLFAAAILALGGGLLFVPLRSQRSQRRIKELV